MVTYLSPNLNLGITQPTEPQTLLHELQRIRQTVIYEGGKFFRQWQPTIARQTFVDSALNLAYYLDISTSIIATHTVLSFSPGI